MPRLNILTAVTLFISMLFLSSHSQALTIKPGTNVNEKISSSSLAKNVDLRGACWKRHRRCTKRHGRGGDYRRCMRRNGCFNVYRKCSVVRRVCRTKFGRGRDYRRCVRRKNCRAFF